MYRGSSKSFLLRKIKLVLKINLKMTVKAKGYSGVNDHTLKKLLFQANRRPFDQKSLIMFVYKFDIAIHS